MGIRHGAYCVGCCWVLMGLLFFGGIMNLLDNRTRGVRPAGKEHSDGPLARQPCRHRTDGLGHGRSRGGTASSISWDGLGLSETTKERVGLLSRESGKGHERNIGARTRGEAQLHAYPLASPPRKKLGQTESGFGCVSPESGFG